ncbi:MAG: hypothetical protein IT292_09505, partial [Deltaproteobacteria bacterium]|nr:hypothetical protein [Deltaproteobacteria bacterium]
MKVFAQKNISLLLVLLALIVLVPSLSLSEPLTMCGSGTGSLPTAWTRVGDNIYYNKTDGKVGIGTSDPQELLHVVGEARFSTLSGGCAIVYTDNNGNLSCISDATASCPVGSSVREIKSDGTVTCEVLSTSNMTEGTNLFWTQARFDTAFDAKTTDDLTEGLTNLYYTNTRVRNALSVSTPITYNSSTGAFGFIHSGDLVGTTNQITVSGGADVMVGANDVTLTLPQDIHTAASPTFNNLSLSGSITSLGVGANSFTGALNVRSGIMTGADGQSGALRIYSEQGVTDYTVAFLPNPSMTQNTNYILPPNDGDTNQILITNGSGTLTWASATAGTVAGLGTIAAQNYDAVNITGGNITGLTNLTSASGTITTFGSTTATLGTATITGAATVGTTLGVTGTTTLGNTLTVSGATSLGSTLGVTGATTLNNTLRVIGATDIDSSLNVDGNSSLIGTLGVTGATTLGSTLGVTGNTTLSGTLGVTGTTYLGDNTSIASSKWLGLGAGKGRIEFTDAATDAIRILDTNVGIGTTGVPSAVVIEGSLDVDSITVGNMTITDDGGIQGIGTIEDLVVNDTAQIGGTLGVTGATTLQSTLYVTGNTTLAGTLGVTGTTTLESTLNVVDDVDLDNNLNVDGDSTLIGTLAVTGATTLGNTLGVTDAVTFKSTLGVTGATTLGSTLGVTGNTT